jgi:hypothetical protein
MTSLSLLIARVTFQALFGTCTGVNYGCHADRLIHQAKGLDGGDCHPTILSKQSQWPVDSVHELGFGLCLAQAVYNE